MKNCGRKIIIKKIIKEKYISKVLLTYKEMLQVKENKYNFHMYLLNYEQTVIMRPQINLL